MPSQPLQPEFTIRTARPEDAEAICRLHVASIRALCARDYTPEQIEAWAGPKRAADYVRGMETGEAMYVAEARGELSSFACRLGNELRALYVAPAATGRGVGSALLQRLEDDAIAAGICALELQSTITAASFYQARGYTRGEPVARLMRGVAVPCIPMQKTLEKDASKGKK